MFRRHVRISREIRVDIYESGEKRARLEYLVRNEMRLFQLLPVFSLILFRSFILFCFSLLWLLFLIFCLLHLLEYVYRQTKG